MKKRRLFRYIKFILGILCILVSSIVLFISFSRTGLNWVGHYYINQTLSPRQCSIASINGNLLQDAVFENVAILEAKKIGRASDILIHHLKLQWHPWRKYPITMSGLDADILLTGQNKLHISGSYANDTFQLKCSSPRIPLENITKSETFPLKYLMGSFHNINMNIAGSLEKPLLSGIVQLEDFNLLRMFTLNGHISFKLYCDLQNSNPSLFGNITFNQLRFSFLKSIFSLDGRIRLHGPIDQAIIDISGTSQINGANIDIQINGPIQNINYQFGSDKALSAFQFITALIFKQDFYLEPGLIKGSMLQISKQIFLFACEKLFQNIIKELFHAELVTCDLPQFDAYQTVMLRNIVIHNSDYLPQNNTLSLEKLSFELWPLSSLTDSIMIENATLSIPGSEPLYINGLYRNKRLDAHLLSDKLSLTDVLSQSFPTLTSMIPAIEISALNIHVQASLDSINANGSFIIKSLSLDLMALHDASVIFDLEALIRNDIRLSGFTEFHHAVLKIGQHHIQIGQSKLVFDGDPLRPHLKLNAQTVIESQEITLTVDHKISDPDFTIHIEPESVTNKLPLILLSGKSWAQIQNMYQKSTSETVQLIESHQLNMLLKYIIAYYLKSFDIHYDGLDGTLFNGLILKNMSINDIPVLATPNVFSIENMQFRLIPTDPMDIEFEFNNATLRMAGSDTILIYGSYTVANGYDLKVYSKSSNIWPLLYSITHNPIFKKCSGKTTDIDIHITGPNRLLNIKGTSVIQSLQDGPFILTNCPVDIDLNLKDQQKSLHGKIIFNESMIKIKNTVITLKKSTITYKGDINNPELDIQGMSQIDGVRIFILIKGDIESPELILTSNPEFPQDRLLLMLATGQSWSKTEELLQKGEISPELAKDLSHYLLSGNMSQKLASFMGVDTINVGYDLQTKSMEVMKKVGSKSYISYGLEQTNTTQQQNGELKQKVEVGRQLSDVNAIAIEGSKDSIYSEEQNTATNGSANGSESVMLKFKRKF